MQNSALFAGLLGGYQNCVEKFPLFLLAALVVFAGCKKPNAAAELEEFEEPRLAPQGVYYVAERFSVQTSSGVYGFSVGKQVRLVREEGENLVVTDGVKEATVTPRQVTNDLTVVKALQAGKKVVVARPEEVPRIEPTPDPEALEAIRAEKFSRAIERIVAERLAREAAMDAQLRERRRKEYLEELADLDVRIKAAEAEIRQKQGNQRRGHYRVQGGTLYWLPTSIYSLSADATAISELYERRKILRELVKEPLDEGSQ